MTTYIFVRHGKTIQDPNKDPTEWDLQKDALEKIKTFNLDFDAAYSSTEPKAYKTIEPLTKNIVQLKEFAEIKRTNEYLTNEEFMQIKKDTLENFDYAPEGWETLNQGLKRFKDGLEKTFEETVVIATHGTILAGYLSTVSNQKAYDLWQEMSFCSWYIVKDNRLIEKHI